jgi:hypothetical protein
MKHVSPPDFEPERRLDVRADYREWAEGRIDAVEFVTRNFVRLFPEIPESEIRALPRQGFEAVAAAIVESMHQHAENRR